MKYSLTTSVVLALFVVGECLAGPTHVHDKLHKKRNLQSVNWKALDWNSMGIDWAAAYARGQAEAKSDPNIAKQPEPTTSSSSKNTTEDEREVAAAAVPHETETIKSKSDSISSSKQGSSDSSKPDFKSDSVELWNNLVGASNHRKTFGLSTPTRGKEVGYVSNVGVPEGSNMIKVASATDHIFTNQFINTSKKSMTVVIWNKAASPGMKEPWNADPNLGASIAPEHAALTIPLAPGDSQTVAFLDQSVVGWAQACETRSFSGGFSTTWGEAQFNTTGSGYDVSAIQNPNGSNYIMDISSVEANTCDSTESTNMWITDTSTVGSGSCYISQSTAHLTTKMGGYPS
ncbi:hypothetical protein GcM3_184019 [Golovinomyces cichoracearum]|uniref:Allergen Asp f 4 n=1 Tax=Golovinomyces cichoracearum TaxID=62708 RepID=A0A420HL14_9PEZI|nr:hypothetical protein GcM3_184019 [Golovinomyces cichoracearum]